MADARGYHVNQMLSNVAIRYRNQALVADAVCPPVPVAKESDLYPVFGKEDFRIPNMIRARRGRTAEVEWSLSSTAYHCEEYALSSGIDDRERSDADAFVQLEMNTTEYLTNMLLLGREYRVAALMQATGTFSNAEPDPNWNESSCTPVQDVQDAKAAIRGAIGLEPNLMVIPAKVLDTLRSASAIVDLIKYSKIGIVDLEVLSAIFGVERIAVAGAVYASNEEGDTEALSDVWTDTVGLYYVSPNPNPRTISAGYTFRTRDLQTSSWRSDERKSQFYEVSMVDDEAVTCAGAGYLLTNCNA